MVVMNAISTMFAAMPGAPVETTHFVSQFISWIQDFIGNYGWTVVLFTIALKLVMLPLDLWQKRSMFKNARIMKKIKPQMEKLQVQYANNKQMFQQKQMELYKKEGYSLTGGCLPMIITLVLFFVLFAGFNETTAFNASQEYYEIATIWETTYNTEKDKKATANADAIQAEYDAAYAEAIGEGRTEAEAESAGNSAIRTYMFQFEEELRAIADQAVLDGYQPTGWLWVTNVFMPDGWASKIPNYKDFSEAGFGKLGITADKMTTTPEDYAKHTHALSKQYQGWNGYLIMPALTIALTFFGQFLSKKMNPTVPGGEQAAQQNKMMTWMMPIMMGFFALFYSTIFTIYLFISQLVSLLTQAGFNIYSKIVDKREEDLRLRTTFKH